MITKFFLNCDIFGFIPSFNINKSKNFKTLFGSLISIIVITLIILSIWQFGREILYKLSPSVMESIYIDENMKNLVLTKTNFIFGFSFSQNINLNTKKNINNNDKFDIFNNTKINIDDTIIDIRINFISNFNNLSKKIEIIPCQNFNEFSNNENFKIIKPSNNLTCLDLKNEIELYNDNYKKLNYISLNILKCSNTTKSSNCKSNEEIEKILYGTKINFYMNNPLIDPSNYDEPISHYVSEFNEILSYNIYKEINLKLSNLKIKSDVGWLMEDIRETNSFKIDRKEITFNTNDKTENKELLTLAINLSPNSYLIKRFYIKIQTIAANLGGIIKFLLLSGEIFVYFFSQIEFKEYLVNIFSDNRVETINKNILNSSHNPLSNNLFETKNNPM